MDYVRKNEPLVACVMNIITHMTVAARDRKRLQDIGLTLARFGLDDLLRRLNLNTLLPFLSGNADKNIKNLALPERVCAALEELGPTFVKLGQILATRSDILPPDWTQAFEKLHSRANPVPHDTLLPQMIEDLGVKPEEAFATFDPQPLAAGSIAQVYRARLHNGHDVAVKVQRPGIVPVIEADLRILLHLASSAEEQAPALRRYRPADIVRYLSAAMRDELDFTREGRNAEQIAANFEGQDDIVIPAIHWDYTTPRLLVQDYIDGIKPDDADGLARANLDSIHLAKRGTDAVLQMAFVDGVFHADPHPGNILCLNGNRIGFLDFGMVGRVTPRRRDELMTLIDAIVHEQGAKVRDILIKWSGAEITDPGSLEDDCDMFVSRHRVPPLDFSRAIGDFMALARRHDTVLPADLALLFKALITAEGVARKLDPDIDLIARAAPLAYGRIMDKLSPEMIKGAALNVLLEGRALSSELPGALRGFLRALQRGRFGVDMDIKGLNQGAKRIERAAMRLAVSIVTASFILGLAPRLMSAEDSAFGFPVFTILGLLTTTGGIFWLAFLNRRD